MRRKHIGRRRRGVIVPIASMGDIAFLLIIFFVINSNFFKETQIRVDPPRALELQDLRQSDISVAIDEDGKIYLNGDHYASAKDVEADLTRLLEGRTTDEARLVLFKCDQRIGNNVFEPVLDAIASAGGVIAAIGDKREPPRP